MRNFTITLFAILGLAACGAGPDDGSSVTPGTGDANDTASTSFSAANQTPGVYRDTYRLLDAVAAENDDTTAVDRMHSDVTNKLENTASFDALAEDEKEAVKGLYILALRSMQATHHHPDVARDIGETILKRVLELDRARTAWNASHDAKEQVAFSAANAALIADATETTLTKATKAPIDAQGNPIAGGLSAQTAAQCAAPTTRAVWVPGTSQSVFVPRVCYPDTILPGYCESDSYVEGQCYDVWVNDCSGGHYENRGYYEYTCYSSYDCRNVWRDRYVWVADNYCDDGYYQQQCTSGHYEAGLCYADTTVPGYCISGHYVDTYPTGSWSFRSSGSSDCDPVIPAQTAVAQTSARILSGPLSDGISDDSWRAAVQNLVSTASVPSDGSYVDAMVQIIAASKAAAQ